MTRALFDTNFLIALFDTQHNFHESALDWFQQNRDLGWATCPITENGVLRVLSNPTYSKLKQYRLVDLISLLRQNTRATGHEFWPDDISLLDDNIVVAESVLGPKQLTDVYLLALAVKNDGRLVTFDARISVTAVKGGAKKHIVVL